MTLAELGNSKIRPLKDRIAFMWQLPEKTESGFFLPDQYYAPGLRLGNFYVAKILAVGKGVTEVKINELVLLHEYSAFGGAQTLKREEIYFIEAKDVLCKVDRTFLPKRGGIKQTEKEYNKID